MRPPLPSSRSSPFPLDRWAIARSLGFSLQFSCVCSCLGDSLAHGFFLKQHAATNSLSGSVVLGFQELSTSSRHRHLHPGINTTSRSVPNSSNTPVPLRKQCAAMPGMSANAKVTISMGRTTKTSITYPPHMYASFKWTNCTWVC